MCIPRVWRTVIYRSTWGIVSLSADTEKKKTNICQNCKARKALFIWHNFSTAFWPFWFSCLCSLKPVQESSLAPQKKTETRRLLCSLSATWNQISGQCQCFCCLFTCFVMLLMVVTYFTWSTWQLDDDRQIKCCRSCTRTAGMCMHMDWGWQRSGSLSSLSQTGMSNLSFYSFTMP